VRVAVEPGQRFLTLILSQGHGYRGATSCFTKPKGLGEWRVEIASNHYHPLPKTGSPPVRLFLNLGLGVFSFLQEALSKALLYRLRQLCQTLQESRDSSSSAPRIAPCMSKVGELMPYWSSRRLHTAAAHGRMVSHRTRKSTLFTSRSHKHSPESPRNILSSTKL
jgi:hypothetical protein